MAAQPSPYPAVWPQSQQSQVQDVQQPYYPRQEEQQYRYPPQEAQQHRYTPHEAQQHRYAPQEAQQPGYPPQNVQQPRYPPQDIQQHRYTPQETRQHRYLPQDVQQQRYAPQDAQPYYPRPVEPPNPALPPRPTSVTVQSHSQVSYAPAPASSQGLYLSALPQQYRSQSPQPTQSQQLYFPPPPSAAGQGQATRQSGPVRRRPVSTSYPTIDQPNYASGADRTSQQQNQFYPPPPPRQPSPLHYNPQAVSAFGSSTELPQFPQQSNRYQYQPSNQASHPPPQPPRPQPIVQVYHEPIVQRSTSPSQNMSRPISESQYYQPPPNQSAYVTYSPAPSQTASREIAESEQYQQPPSQLAYSHAPAPSQTPSRDIIESQQYQPPPSQSAYSPSPAPLQAMLGEVSESQHHQKPSNQLAYSSSPPPSQITSHEILDSQQYHQPSIQLPNSSSPPSQTTPGEISEPQDSQQPNQLPSSALPAPSQNTSREILESPQDQRPLNQLQNSPSAAPLQNMSREISEQPNQPENLPSTVPLQNTYREVSELQQYQQPPNQLEYSPSPVPLQNTFKGISELQQYQQASIQLAYLPPPAPVQNTYREIPEPQPYQQRPSQLAYSGEISGPQYYQQPSNQVPHSREISESPYYPRPPNQLAYSREISESQLYQQPWNQLAHSLPPAPSQNMSKDISASLNHPAYLPSPSQPQLIPSNYLPSPPNEPGYVLAYVPASQAQPPVPGISATSIPTIAALPAESRPFGLPAQSEPSGLSTQSDITSSLKKLLTKEKAKEILTKENAKDAFLKGKKLFNQFEKLIEPIMPLLAAADPDVARAYALRQRMKSNKPQQTAAITPGVEQQSAAATPDADQLNTSETPSATGQNTRELSHVEESSGGLENYGPLIAALMQASAQSEAQKSGANAAQGSNPLEALLQAALLQQTMGQAPHSNAALTPTPAAHEKTSSDLAQPPTTTTIVPAQTMTAQPKAVAPTAPPPSVQPENSTLQSLLNAFLLAATMQPTTNQDPISNAFSPSSTASVVVSNPVSSAPPADPSEWVHHGPRVYGISDVLLPPNHNLNGVNKFRLAGEMPSIGAFFQFELLFNDLHVQNKVKKISSMANDPDLTLIEGLSKKDFGISTKVSLEGVMRQTEPENGVYRSMYGAILQSPYGHGVWFTINTPTASLRDAKAAGAAIVASIKWCDRSEFCNDISSSITGSYRYRYMYNSGYGSMGSFRETREYTFAANSRYFYDRSCSVNASVKDNYGNLLVDASAYDPDHVQGVWEAIEYHGDIGNARWLILTEDSGCVEVWEFSGGDGGPLMIAGDKFHKTG